MSNTPPRSNSSRLSTPTPLALPGLRQLTEVSETEPEHEPEHARESRIIIDPASPTSEEPHEMKNKDEEKNTSPSASSDKLSALPSHLPSSPTLRALGAGTRRNKSNSGSPESASLVPLPSSSTITQEAHIAPQTATLPRRAPPVSHSLSDSAAEVSTFPRQLISFGSERGSSTSPRVADPPLPASSEPILPSAQGTHGTTLSSFVARAHESVHERLHGESFYKYKPGHSRTASHGRRNSADSHTRTRSRPGSPQRSPSLRGVLPLRSFLGRFSPLGRAQSREEPFIPVDPFRLHAPISLNPFSRCFGARRRPADEEVASPGQGGGGSSYQDLAPCGTCACVSFLRSVRFHNTHVLAFDTLPRQLYLHSQLGLPSLYFSRVARIFEDAAVSRPEIQRILDTVEAVETEYVQGRTRAVRMLFSEEWVPPNVSPALARFKGSWENFVDSLVREWKTLNVLSALLLSAILTVIQIQDAEGDPVTRTAALYSLISALMSLSYGIMYIIRFGTMRSMYHASRWAEETQKTETAIFWNVWVLLALPGIWLAWSVLAFVVAIMSFVWRTGARGDSHPPLSRVADYGPRVWITFQLFLGLVYMALVFRTFRSYGEIGRKARVVRRLADTQIELETRRELEREREREGGILSNAAGISRTQARENDPEEPTTDDARDRGRRRGGKTDNELGLSGMDRKQESVVRGNGDIQPVSDSYSSLGM